MLNVEKGVKYRFWLFGMTRLKIELWIPGPFANTVTTMLMDRSYRYVHTHTNTHIYIFIYIYIFIHRQAVSLYHNTSVWLDTQDASSWDRNPPNFTLDMVSHRSDIYIYIYIHASPWGLSTLAKELSAAARIMQSSSKELNTLVADRV